MLTDTATLLGSYYSGGTISFSLTDPNGNPVTLPANDQSMTVSGDGDYTTPTGILATEVGTYTWSATYSGDSNNLGTNDDGENESLETVNGPSTDLIWTGGGNNTWSDPNNWQGNVIPANPGAGGQFDELIFNSDDLISTGNMTSVDNIPGLTVASIIFQTDGFTITGNTAITINSDNGTIAGNGNGIVASNTTGTNKLNLNVAFNTTAPTISQAAGGTLILVGKVTNGGLPVTVSSAGNVSIGGVISGTGTLTQAGTGTLTLSGKNTFASGLNITAGTVLGTTSANAFGTGTITIGDFSGSANATLVVGTTGLTIANPIVLATGTFRYADGWRQRH